MKKLILILSSLVFFTAFVNAQMTINGNTVYGNEWIDYDNAHYKFLVQTDGMYRVSKQTLASAGVPINTAPGESLKVFQNGEELPIYVSTSGTLGNSDYIEFYAKRNRGELDEHLYESPETEHMSQYTSMFTDSSSVFITWDLAGGNNRFTDVQNNLTNPPAAEPYYLHNVIGIKTNKYHKGKPYSSTLYNSKWNVAEGYAHSFATTRNIAVSTSNRYLNGPNPEVSFVYCTNEGSHQTSVEVSSNIIHRDTFFDYKVKKETVSFDKSYLANSTNFIFKGLTTSNDKIAPASVNLNYARTFNFLNRSFFEFSAEASTTDKFIVISNFSHDNVPPVLYDITNKLRIVTEVNSNGMVRVVIPPSAQKRELLLVNQAGNGHTEVASLEERNFTDFSDVANQGDYIIISNDVFMSASPNYVEQYRAYRQSTGFSAITVDIQELYDQFSFGIHRNPLSIRNFTGYITEFWNNPKYIFIIGKGRNYQSVRSNLVGQPMYVPTFGQPPSDNLLVATLDSNTPRIPIGRIPVKYNDEIEIYLRKMKAYEGNNASLSQTLDDKVWMKRMLHLGGGDPGIQNSIQNNLNSYKTIIEEDQFGAEVTSFFKTSTDPIQISQSEFLDSLIDTGVSLITFFGHASTESFDFSIDSPENYNNYEKYPVILSLGCFTGHIHQTDRNLGETFVFAEDKGAIAFMASVSLSTLSSLNSLARDFYKDLSGNGYDTGIGDIMKYAIGTNNASALIQQQMTINGDPAVRFNIHSDPDYLVNGPTVNFTPEEILVTDDIELSFDVTNIGRSIADSFFLKVVRTLPNGIEIEVAKEWLPTPKFTKNYSFNIPAVAGAVGQNKFTITVDADDLIVEGPAPAGENNNTYTINQFIFTDDIIPVYPYEFSIVPDPSPVLRASISNAFSEEFTYYMEIDTTELFNSPIKQSTTAQLSGGMMEWKPSIPYVNNRVYYWRVQIDPVQAPNSSGWKASSFIYLDSEYPGWNQSHYYQFLKDRFVNMQLPANREFKFIDDFKEIKVNTAIYSNLLGFGQLNYAINNSIVHSVSGCTSNNNGIYFVVLDPADAEPTANPGQQGSGTFGDYNSINCKPELQVFRYRTTDSTGRRDAVNFLRDPSIIPNGHYVMVYTLYDYQPSEWAGDNAIYGDDLFTAMNEELGSVAFQSTANNLVPFTGLYKKRDLSFTPEEVLGDSTNAILSHRFQLQGSWDSGNLVSTAIGPAQEWQSLEWEATGDNNDEFSVDVIGIDPLGNETPVMVGITNFNEQLTTINAQQFPYIRLVFNSEDVMTKTTAQLDYWRVIFKEMPDCALRPDVHFVLKDTIQQGEAQNLQIAIQNVSNEGMTPLLFQYTIVDENNQQIVAQERLPALPVGSTITGDFTINTRNLTGTNKLILEANPSSDQPEKYFFNNIGVTKFFVEKDIRNPILDVTFDGQHIMDGDIVSAKPGILISLNDENKYLELGDTSLIEVRLLKPGESLPAKPVYFNSGEMQFFPANPANLSSENKAYVEFNPTFLEDGTYNLFVLARDPSKNESGALNYKVSFNVINKASISNILNYPNPFTSSTQFVFTLTGSELPDFMKIQIMTVTGKVVREISMDELGPLHIGNNRTEYAWDGTDEFGSKLANGVYLYRVLSQLNQQEIERYQTNTNQYFKSGFGKMYLMR